MSRPLRILYPGAYYHITNEISSQHRKLFRRTQDRIHFLKLLESIHSTFQVKVHAYHLREKAYDILLCTPKPNLPRAIRHLDGLYTQYFNRTYHKSGSLFRGRYTSILVDVDAYFLPLIHFIHHDKGHNRIDHEGAKELISSLYYCSRPNRIPSWLFLHEAIITLCPEYGSDIRSAYQRYAAEEYHPDIVSFYKKKRKGRILGKEEFIRNICMTYPGASLQETSMAEANASEITTNSRMILGCLKFYYGITDRELLASKRGVANEYRKAAIYILRHSGYTLKKIMEILRYNTYVAVSYNYHSISRQITDSPQFKKEIQNLQSYIEQESSLSYQH